MQQFAPQSFMEALDGVLGTAVRGLERNAAIGQRRADVDDRARVAGHHSAKGGHRPVHITQIVHVSDPFVFGCIDVGELGEHRGERHVHPDFDRSERLLGTSRGGLDLIGIGDVGAQNQRLTPGVLDVGSSPGQSSVAARDESHFRAAGRECLSGCAPNPATGTGNDHDLPSLGVRHQTSSGR